jgi:hypothetical protein
MKKVIAFSVAIIISACSQAQPTADFDSAVGTAVALTQAAQPIATDVSAPTTMASPSKTPSPTLMPAPTNTVEPTVSLDETRESILADVVDILESLDDVEAVNLARFDHGALEIELQTVWASQDSQPDVSYTIIRLLSTMFGDIPQYKLGALTSGLFQIHLVTYSTDGDYRYESLTDLETLNKVLNKEISYEEWLTAANAGFR